MPLFKDIIIDGYFCWNRSFEDYARSADVFSHKPRIIQTITSRFSDVDKYQPAKEKNNWVVFASRLDEQKHPEMFIKAISILNDKHPDILTGWKFLVCGEGSLRSELMDYAIQHSIDTRVEFRIEGKMENVLNYSKIYVSCQDFDNFPSLSMAEAMASSNAIIARNVGQTDLFVKHNINGLLIEPDNEHGLVRSLLQLLGDAELLASMAKESSLLIKTVHSFDNFVPQIESFWAKI